MGKFHLVRGESVEGHVEMILPWPNLLRKFKDGITGHKQKSKQGMFFLVSGWLYNLAASFEHRRIMHGSSDLMIKGSEV